MIVNSPPCPHPRPLSFHSDTNYQEPKIEYQLLSSLEVKNFLETKNFSFNIYEWETFWIKNFVIHVDQRTGW